MLCGWQIYKYLCKAMLSILNINNCLRQSSFNRQFLLFILQKKINRLGPICWFFVFKSPPFCGLQYSLWLFSSLFPSQFSRWFIIQLLKPKCFTLQCTSLVFLSTTTIVVLISISGNLYSLLTYSSFMYNSWNSIDSLFQNRYHQAELLPTKVHSNMSSCLSSYSISFVYMTV